jgi:dTDP-4-amino-4,6-dideoxygalactose transaminase
LDPVQAAALRVKLKFLDEWNARRAVIAARYTAELTASRLFLPAVPDWAEPVWHLYVVRHPERDALQAALQEAGIRTQIHYPIPPHLQSAYATLDYKEGRFPIAEGMAKQLLSLPIGPQLDGASVEAVIAALHSALQQLKHD